MVDFNSIISFLKTTHFYDVILPLLLVYTITFGVLKKTKIFSSGNDEENDNLYAVIALVFALLVIGSIETVRYIESIITNVIVFLIFIVVILISLGMIFGEDLSKIYKENDKLNLKIVGPIVAFILTIITIIALKALGLFSYFSTIINWLTSDAVITMLIIAGIGAAIYIISK